MWVCGIDRNRKRLRHSDTPVLVAGTGEDFRYASRGNRSTTTLSASMFVLANVRPGRSGRQVPDL